MHPHGTVMNLRRKLLAIAAAAAAFGLTQLAFLPLGTEGMVEHSDQWDQWKLARDWSPSDSGPGQVGRS